MANPNPDLALFHLPGTRQIQTQYPTAFDEALSPNYISRTTGCTDDIER